MMSGSHAVAVLPEDLEHFTGSKDLGDIRGGLIHGIPEGLILGGRRELDKCARHTMFVELRIESDEIQGVPRLQLTDAPDGDHDV
jgi:hypothetical protein